MNINPNFLDDANFSALLISFASSKFSVGHNMVAGLGVTGIVDYQDIRILLVQSKYDQTVRGYLLNTTTLE